MKRGKGNPIPPESRTLVEDREALRCLRCGGAGSDWHHRRTRAVKDKHQHCPCNGVLLCGTCHRWAHGHPEQARVDGFVVSRFMSTPFIVPVVTWHGAVTLHCGGGFTPVRTHPPT